MAVSSFPSGKVYYIILLRSDWLREELPDGGANNCADTECFWAKVTFADAMKVLEQVNMIGSQGLRHLIQFSREVVGCAVDFCV